MTEEASPVELSVIYDKLSTMVEKYKCLSSYGPTNIENVQKFCQFLRNHDKRQETVSSYEMEWEGKQFVMLIQEKPAKMNGDHFVVPTMAKILQMTNTTQQVTMEETPRPVPQIVTHTQLDDVPSDYNSEPFEDDHDAPVDVPPSLTSDKSPPDSIERGRKEIPITRDPSPLSLPISSTPKSIDPLSTPDSLSSQPTIDMFQSENVFVPSSPQVSTPSLPTPSFTPMATQQTPLKRKLVMGSSSDKKRTKPNIQTQKVDGTQQLIRDLKNRLRKIEVTTNNEISFKEVIDLAIQIKSSDAITPDMVTMCHKYDETLGLAEFYNSVIWGGVFAKTYLNGTSNEWDQRTVTKFISNHNLPSRRFGNFTNAVLSYHLFCYGKNEYYFISQNQCKLNSDGKEESESVESPNLMGYPLDLIRGIHGEKRFISVKDIFEMVLPDALDNGTKTKQ